MKTLIVQYNYLDFSREYTKEKNRVILSSYGSFLVYFDVEGKECIGYDLLSGPELPSSVLVDESYGQPTVLNNDNLKFNPIWAIVEKIESRLMNPAE